MEEAVNQIKMAMANTLSLNEQLRNEAQDFITKQCEPVPHYQQVLLHIIASYNRQTARPSQDKAGWPPTSSDSQWSSAPGGKNESRPQFAAQPPEINDQMMQYQAILFMKNSLTRLLSMHRKQKRYTRLGPPGKVLSGQSSVQQTLSSLEGLPPAVNQQSQLTPEFKEDLKSKILALIQNPDECILGENAYNQLTRVACIFVQQDFPSQWPQLNQWLLGTFSELFTNINRLQTEDAPRVQRFLNFYFQVLVEQNKKKLSTQKGHFYKVARDHLKAVYKVWEFFNYQQTRMIFDVDNNCLNVQNYNKLLFDIAAKLDKCLMLVIACGFNLNDLLHEPVDNQYVQVLKEILKKLRFFTQCVEQLAKIEQSEQTKPFYDLFEAQIKSLLKHLNQLQNSEALLFHKSLGDYIHAVAQIVFHGDLHSLKVKKLAIFSMYSVVTTTIYNQGNQDQATSGNRDGKIGLLISPMKFKNFEPQLIEAAAQYHHLLEMPDPSSSDPMEQNRQDGARQLIQLLFQKYLPLSSLDQWQQEPESFIELEDDNYLMLEFDMDPDMTLSLLTFQLIDKLIEKFYSTTFPFIQGQLLQQYFTGGLKLQSELQEDALLSIVCMLGKIHKDNKTPKEQQLDVCYVLDMLRESKWESLLFQRRYIHILNQWVKLIPKQKFPYYFKIILDNLANTTDYVLIYEHCTCIHEMLKEIDYWLKQYATSNNSPKASCILGTNSSIRRAQADVLDFGQSSGGNSEKDEQIALSLQIHKGQIDYLRTFQVVCQKLGNLFNVFVAPILVWKMVNYLSFILEKNTENTDQLIECLNQLNINKLLQLNSEQVHEALIDMLKQLLGYQPSSPVILEMCVNVLDHCLTKTQHLDELLKFWVFTMRITSLDNPNKFLLKNLFMKFCTSYGSVKKEHLFIEFLKVAQECALQDSFNTQAEIHQVIEFAYQKFAFEVDSETAQQQRTAITGAGESSSGDSDSDFNEGVSNYEKKLHILHIPHIILWKTINEKGLRLSECQLGKAQALQFILTSEKKFILMCTSYLISNRSPKTMPTISSFFTYLLTFLNRIIIEETAFFMQDILQVLHQDKGQTFAHFLQSWFQKMDFITSRESLRINLIAIYTMLPFLDQQLLSKYFSDVARLTFSQLDDFMYLKQTNSPAARTWSPSKISSLSSDAKCTFPYGGPGALQQKNVRLAINYVEKMSQRLEQLKKEDPILRYDLIDVFNESMRKVQANMGLPNLEPLLSFLPSKNDSYEEHLRNLFKNLIANKSTRA